MSEGIESSSPEQYINRKQSKSYYNEQIGNWSEAAYASTKATSDESALFSKNESLFSISNIPQLTTAELEKKYRWKTFTPRGEINEVGSLDTGLKRNPYKLKHYGPRGGISNADQTFQFKNLKILSVEEINKLGLFEMNLKDSKEAVLAKVVDDVLIIGNRGDSHAVLIHDGKAEQLTETVRTVEAPVVTAKKLPKGFEGTLFLASPGFWKSGITIEEMNKLIESYKRDSGKTDPENISIFLRDEAKKRLEAMGDAIPDITVMAIDLNVPEEGNNVRSLTRGGKTTVSARQRMHPPKAA